MKRSGGIRSALLRCAWLMCLGPGCAGDEGWSGMLPAADFALYRSTAYPALMNDCAFSECHGSEQRFFQVFGPGRTRLDPTTKADDPVTDAELQLSYQRSLSMLTSEGDLGVAHSLLLKKPLEAAQGGVGHRGVDDYGRNVYATPQAAGYQALLRWAQSASSASSAPHPRAQHPHVGDHEGSAP